MSIHKATRKYEVWIAQHATLVAADLDLKHQRMAESPFAFLRATFYRWAELWPRILPELAAAPAALAVGDLHIENFGTWRDADGRLVWGVNDFDEAYPLAYTNDLVRLATSANLAIEEAHLAVSPREAADAILAGYMEAIASGGAPFILEERHGWLRKLATGALRDPEHFWKKMDELPPVKHTLPASARQALATMLPERGLAFRVAHRIAGLGSLGRERYVALADWRGGKVAREAKALFTSACVWALGGHGLRRVFYQEILDGAVRCADPFVRLRAPWIVRRLAPHCSRVELAALPKERDEVRLLRAMGFEAANVHLGTKQAIPAIHRDLKKRPAGWLEGAAKTMAKAVSEEWKNWRAKPDYTERYRL